MTSNDQVIDAITELFNELAEFSHGIMDIIEEWKRREEENHVILLKIMDDLFRLKQHLKIDQSLTEKASYR